MKNVYIIGAGMTAFGKYLELEHRDLAKTAIDEALQDAKMSSKDVQTAHVSNCLWGYFKGQHGIRGQIIMAHCGMRGIPVFNHEGACASAVAAFHSAWKDIQTGLYDCTLAVGVEKLADEDKAKSLSAFNAFVDVEHPELSDAANADMQSKDLDPSQVPASVGQKSIFMDGYGLGGRIHMKKYGSTIRQFATVAAKNHNNGALNPKAQYRFTQTIEQVLEDRMVSYPLTRAMCAPTGDGAAAAILCSEDYLRKLPQQVQDRAVKIMASVYTSDLDYGVLVDGMTGPRRAAMAAYEMAGVGPKDIDVVEVHDASAVGEIKQTEDLALFEYGKGGEAAEAGVTAITGDLPVNPSGGLIARGHPIGATGLAQMYELVLQLRGEAGERQVKAPKIALAQNAGGDLHKTGAALAVTILTK